MLKGDKQHTKTYTRKVSALTSLLKLSLSSEKASEFLVSSIETKSPSS